VTEVEQLHREAIVADTHNDLLMLTTQRPRASQSAYFRDKWLPQLRAGGVDIQVLPVYIDDEYRPEGALRRTLNMLASAWRIAADNADAVQICLSGDDVRATLASNRIAIILALEGCEAVGSDVGLFEPLHRLGVRMASFTHWGRTQLGDGSGVQDTGGRLPGAGIDAVQACEELGIMLDVSHLGAVCTDHLLELATRPVIASHSSSFALRPHHRNLTDERLRGLASSGGVIGVNFLAGFVDPTNRTVARVVDHIEHVVATVGIDHVGLGPDFIAEVWQEKMPTATEYLVDDFDALQYVEGLEGPVGLPLVTAEMLQRGWADSDIKRALGGNFHDLFLAELGRPGR
jgi:membrane dipeptidase